MSLPPVHPAFVHYPIALLFVSLILDVVAKYSNKDSLRVAAWWTLFAGALGGALAGLSGFFDMNRMNMTSESFRYVNFHMVVGIAVLVCAVILTGWRWYLHRNNRATNWGYLTAAFVVVAMVFSQGWIGGELVYSYGVGVAPTGQSSRPESEAKAALRSLDKIAIPLEPSKKDNIEDKSIPTSSPRRYEIPY